MGERADVEVGLTAGAVSAGHQEAAVPLSSAVAVAMPASQLRVETVRSNVGQCLRQLRS